MSKYRNNLPQLNDKIFLTDGGLETTLVFHERIELQCFAAFPLLREAKGLRTLQDYYRRYAGIARANGAGFILESASWRANRDWAEKLGISPAELAELNRRSIEMLVELRTELETPQSPMVISGCVGPRGDGYSPTARMSAEEAEAYHAEQIAILAQTEADMISAFTMNYAEEATGIALAASKADMPAAISFTLETDGRLATGQSLREAIEQVDAATAQAPAYYMINCAHPTHFRDALARGESWTARLRGIRANASQRSHAELDAAPDLDIGDPMELGRQYRDLRRSFGHVNILGGCCGTDHRHVGEISRACLPADATQAA